jgi:hypothetical protein
LLFPFCRDWTRRIVVEPELVAAIVALNVTRRAQETPKIAVIRT